MRIQTIKIDNFRCLQDFKLEAREGVNVVIGENNAGKSAVLHALDRVLGRSHFDLEDFFITAPVMDPYTLPRIRVVVTFCPSGAQFSAAFISDFVDEIAVTPDGARLIFGVEAFFDVGESRVNANHFIVKADGSEQNLVSRKRHTLRSYAPFYLADAFRDTLRELRSRRGFWGRLVDSVLLDQATNAAVAQAVAALNTTIQNASPRLADLRTRIGTIGQVIPTAPPPDDVTVNPVSLDSATILRNLEVLLRTVEAPRAFPLERHGEGTRSIAFLVIFRAFVDLLAQEEWNNAEAAPILGIEEPEVHLHPHASRSVASFITSFQRQVFLTTHSPAITRHVQPDAVSLIRRFGQGCVASRVPLQHPTAPAQPFFAPREQTILQRILRAGGSEAYFARAAVLFEGESELRALPVFADALGIDLNLLGISLVSVDGKAYRHFLRLIGIESLRIPWVILSDGEDLPELANHLQNASVVTAPAVAAATAANRIEQDILLPNDCYAFPGGADLERALLDAGGRPEFEAVIDELSQGDLARFVAANAARVGAMTPDDQIHEYMRARRWGKKSKPLIAGLVADRMTNGGTNAARIPPAAAQALRRAEAFATRAAQKYP